jgi:hypothetical protein
MTVMVKNFTLLTKSLRPLPLPKVDAEGNVFDGFTDAELRYRQRYGFGCESSCERNLRKRTKLFNAMRTFFNDEVISKLKRLFYNRFLVELQQDHLSHITMLWIFLYILELLTNYI